ncbi:hypothetical protein VTO42DRAFT_191 [Malbranchea cinnamomea]
MPNRGGLLRRHLRQPRLLSWTLNRVCYHCQTVFVIPFLLLLTLVGAVLLAMGESLALTHIRYSTVTGYFVQDDPATDPHTIDIYKTDFGLIDQTYDTDAEFDPDREKSQWERFEYKIRHLNRNAAPDTEFKLLYLGRHGQGYHNVAEALYGTAAWECHWAKLEGDGNITWSDPELTELGVQQAENVRDTWLAQMENGIPLPETYYTSPLKRCLETAKITFARLPLPSSKPFIPTVKELLRETIGIHTCDRRSSRTYIRTAYPTYRIEHGFAETDPLWDPELRESNSARTARMRTLLDDIFTHDSSTFVSLTAHGGAIESILEAVGHRHFHPPIGGVVPVLVRAERKRGARPPETVDPPHRAPDCTVNPTAALAN